MVESSAPFSNTVSRFAICAILLHLAGSVSAECNDIIKAGIFDLARIRQETALALDWVNWKCEHRFESAEKMRDASQGLGVKAKGFRLTYNNASADSEWSKFENSVCESQAGRHAFAQSIDNEFRTANKDIVDAWKSCMSTAVGFFVGYVPTANPNEVVVYARWKDLEDRKRRIGLVEFDEKAIKLARSLKNTPIGSDGTRVIVTRLVDGATTLNIVLTGGTFNAREVVIPPKWKPLPEHPKPMLWQEIQAGKTFTIVFNALTAPIGTIQPGVTLTGTYTQGTGSWDVWGQHPGNKCPSHGKCPYAFPGLLAAPVRPEARLIAPWGAVLRYDDSGNVYLNGKVVGRLSLVQ